MSSPPVLLLDACSLINIYATRHGGEILALRAEQCAMVAVAHREANHVRRGGTGPDRDLREPIDWPGLLSNGLLTIIDDASEDEATLYFDLSLDMGGGEAMSGAVAFYRGHSVVTDDAKAIRILSELGIETVSSLELVADWARKQRLSAETLQQIVLDIRLRAKYLPGKNHPLRMWWIAALDAENGPE